MDLDDLDDTAVTVWVSRVDTGEDTIVVAWSLRCKAEQWAAHELDVEPDSITWRDTGVHDLESGLQGTATAM